FSSRRRHTRFSRDWSSDVCSSDLKDYSRAISIYSAILQEENKGTTDFARILTNYATAMWQYQKSYNPVKDLTHALSIRKQKNDLWGQNSSYAYLSDYRSEERRVGKDDGDRGARRE